MAKMLLKLIIVILAIFVSAYSICFSQTNNGDKITFSTYYPAPYAVFSELRLIPHSDPQTDCKFETRGMIRLNLQNELLICNGEGWVGLGGGFWTMRDDRLVPNESVWTVGVGTNTPDPAYKLDVYGQVNGRGGLCIGSNCKVRWDSVSCPANQCLVSVSFNSALQKEVTAQSDSTYRCVPCGGTGTTTPVTSGSSASSISSLSGAFTCSGSSNCSGPLIDKPCLSTYPRLLSATCFCPAGSTCNTVYMQSVSPNRAICSVDSLPPGGSVTLSGTCSTE